MSNALNTIAENITVDGGTLAVSGALTGSMTLQNLGTLKPGTIADPTGTLNTGALNVGSTGVLRLDIGGTAAGDSDQLSVTGSVTLAGMLNASLFDGYIPGGADALTIILNDDVDLVSGTFTGLPEGAPVGATGLYITYAGGDGNDVVLTAVPEPGSAVMLLGGLAILGARRRRR